MAYMRVCWNRRCGLEWLGESEQEFGTTGTIGTFGTAWKTAEDRDLICQKIIFSRDPTCHNRVVG